MSRSSTRLLLKHLTNKPSPSQFLSHPPHISQTHRTHFSSSPISKYLQNPLTKPVQRPDLLLKKAFLGFRFINFKASELGTKFNPLNKNSINAKSVVKKPVNAIGEAVTRYRGAVGSQIEAFWKRKSLVLWGAGGLMAFSVMFGTAYTLVGLSEGMSEYGFLVLPSAIAFFVFAGLYLRFSFRIDKVYRIAMRRLNTDAGILEVMGAPLSGTDFLSESNGVYLCKRCVLVFPIRGSESKGLVSVEVKKKNGQYDIKLLAVDIPMISGPDRRIFLIGNEEDYRVSRETFF